MLVTRISARSLPLSIMQKDHVRQAIPDIATFARLWSLLQCAVLQDNLPTYLYVAVYQHPGDLCCLRG
eukprot:2133654-Amphidinium_carterae.1